MKNIRLTLEDDTYKKLKEDKERKNCTWREYLKLAYKWEHNPDQYQHRKDGR